MFEGMLAVQAQTATMAHGFLSMFGNGGITGIIKRVTSMYTLIAETIQLDKDYSDLERKLRWRQ